MAQAELVVVLVELEDDDVDDVTGSDELARVLELVPGEVADVDQTLDAVLQLGEHAEVGDVADGGLVGGTHGILLADGLPRILGELLQTEGHLAGLAVQGEDDGLDLVAELEELLGAVQARAPGHLAHMDETLDTGFDLDESAVVGDGDDLALHGVTDLEVGGEALPRVRGELLQAEGDALLRLVEVEHHDIDLLVQGDHLFRMGDAAPAEVGDVDETVHAAEVHEHAVVGDVLDGTLEHLAFLQLGDEFGALGLLLGLEKGLVGDDHVAELLVDLDDLEVHGGIHEHVIVTDGLDVDLGTREEGLDAEHVDDHAALRAGLDITLHHLVVLVGGVDHIPRLELAGFLVGNDQLALAVLGVLDEHLDLVTDLEVRVVTELGGGDDTFALGADVHDDLTLVDRGDDTLDHLVLGDLLEGLVVQGGHFLAVLTGDGRR